VVTLKLHNSDFDCLYATNILTLRQHCLGFNPHFGNHWIKSISLSVTLSRLYHVLADFHMSTNTLVQHFISFFIFTLVPLATLAYKITLT